MIPLSIPNLAGNEWKYIKECLDENFVSTAGKYVDKFEHSFANFLGIDRAVAMMNGTAALHIALRLSGVLPNDEVIAPNLTFIAPLNAIEYQFATPILLDSDPNNYGISEKSLKKFLENQCEVINDVCINKETGAIVRAIILVHIFGYSANLFPIIDLCRKFNIKLIEDASEALGTKYKGKYCGTLGDFGCFSFNGNKIMTTGGGGMLIAKNEQLLAQAKHLSTTAKIDNVYFDHDEVGYNYRMVNILAALGCAQIEQLHQFLEIKKQNFLRYKEIIDNINGLSLLEDTENEPNYWFYPLIVEESFPLTRDELMNYLIENSIQVRPIWKLMEDLPMFKRSANLVNLSISRSIYNKVLNIPCSTNLKEEDLHTVCEILKKASTL